jgi:guanidinopropionase
MTTRPAIPPALAENYWPLDSSSNPRFAGPVSFFRLPMLKAGAEADIALVGLPWDGGTTNRAGARHGPREIRAMSTLIRPFHHVSRTSPYDICRVADFGDAPVNPISVDDTLQRVEGFFRDLHQSGATPLSAGGDHLVTLPILRAIAKDGPVGLIQFDAHSDTNDSYFGGHRFTHGTHVRRAIEEGLVDPRRTIQIGIRGSRYRPDGGDFGEAQGIRAIHIEEFFRLGAEGVAREIHSIIGSGPAYVTFDVDSLDPAYAPGTGTPEAGGFTTFDAQQMIRGLRGLDLVGGDVVEVAPPFDPNGNTALIGATMMFEILCVLATATAQRKTIRQARKP